MTPTYGSVEDKPSASLSLSFENSRLLPMLFGRHDEHLQHIERKLGVFTASRGNTVVIQGKPENVLLTRQVLESLYRRLEKSLEVDIGDIDAAIRMAGIQKERHMLREEIVFKTLKKQVAPRSPMQAHYMETLQQNELVFALGPAGTGKTYLAVAAAVAMYLSQKVDRIVLSRPALEAGEKLGFLPGDMREKVDPYLRPLYDALYDMLPAERVQKSMEAGEIEIAPLAFMRGRTLKHAFVILDEAQNATPVQMKMFLTRLGEGSRMVITGDLTQTDLPKDVPSGLFDAIETLKHIDSIAMVRFSEADIVRHALTIKIVEAYNARAAKRAVKKKELSGE